MQQRKRRKKRAMKPKICRFCEESVNYIDYLNGMFSASSRLKKAKFCRVALPVLA